MMEKLFPFLITKIENGALLYYFIPPNLGLTFSKIKEIKYQFMFLNDMIFCIFNDSLVVPMEILKEFDYRAQRFLYFMKYSLESIYSEILFVFEITDEFLINYKGFEHFLEYKKKTEEMGKKEIEQEKKEEITKAEETKTEEEVKALN